MTTIKLDPGAALLLDALHGAGHAAYAVGGCVRDSLLGLDPHDWDLCTSARPEQVMALFGEEKCIPTGLQHGTVTVKQGGRLYETTTFRTEGAYSDGRHPDAVCFVPDVQEDLARRDFTINAMAYSAEEGLIDPFGGRDDLAAHLVRAVGEPERRFEEDALRILRLYRFAARFGFAIDPATGAAARALGPHLDCVSAERIQEELLKLLAAPRPGSYLEPAVLAVVLPELEPEKQPERFAELCRTIDRIEPTAENVPARLAALLCPLGEAGARKALRKLKCSNALTDEVTALEREAGGSAGSFLLGHEFELRHPADALCLERHSHPAGRCPNSNSLFPPQAAVVAVAGHSIARPIACGNRVPPQRTVLGETPDTPNTTLTVQAKRLLGCYELPTIKRLTALCSAWHPEQAEAFAALRAEAERLTAENACCRVSQLAVNGRDLMAAGVRPGPGLRQVLNALLEAVITGQTPNEKDALLAAAAQFSAS
ncbi:tRNA nucleotidyltransferase [Faecalibacterium sp. CLA-AA-H283]|uniref:CCA tRNA nucleotidyltransferase n=1 Tax=Faecalibacterium TaxID=216851 RepID=UPI001D0EF7FC|nr:tRNA nucleotidyltransferase [Faecalibacterium hominis (ex Afrizal et al. 2022)]MCC2139623.1 tRNA nucleotidyltransferase [Faecalibacterium hominis (ex Afrizal et al. 2022)]